MDRENAAREKEPEPVCKCAVYFGRVQGVGFRYTAQQLAEEFAVNGYVRNLPEGTVEIVAEGSASQVDGFLTAIERRMEDYVTKAAVQDAPLAGYKGFRIRY